MTNIVNYLSLIVNLLRQLVENLQSLVKLIPKEKHSSFLAESTPTITPKEAITKSILHVQYLADDKGKYLFTNKNQWYGIYRILVDKKMVKNQSYGDFGIFIDSLQISGLRVNLNARELNKYNKGTMADRFEKWDISKATSVKRFEKIQKIAAEFKAKLEELLSE